MKLSNNIKEVINKHKIGQREIARILEEIERSHTFRIVLVDDSKVRENMEGYRNDGGIYLHHTITFINGITEIELEYEGSFGHVNRTKYTLTRKDGIKELINNLKCVNDNYFVIQCNRLN